MAKSKLDKWALTALRVVLGVIFLYHGYAKLFVTGGFKGTVGFFAAVGIPLPAYSALLVSVVEFVGGILLLIGLLTKWTSAVLILEMLVALFSVHLENGFLVAKGGYEYVLLILAGLAVVMVTGTGKLSAAKWFRKIF